ncbi:hypothetical protein H5410_064803 [Solanum commersonii]|uniref:Uncharacterized protein n=1 Tax=Solanum commersonii TaxID=4109 RepID=A0A9J5VYP1_SOLCO|nr:hypothetical protein H5410_064803 [Solanum commersonii]
MMTKLSKLVQSNHTKHISIWKKTVEVSAKINFNPEFTSDDNYFKRCLSSTEYMISIEFSNSKTPI